MFACRTFSETLLIRHGDSVEPDVNVPLATKASGVALWQQCLNPGVHEFSQEVMEAESATDSFSSSEPHDDESISEDENAIAVAEVCVEKHKYWTTVEDANLARIDALAKELREKPLLPPHPEDPQRPWLDTTSGVALPVCHCAFLGCAWVSHRCPCPPTPAEGGMWQGSESCWIKTPPRRLDVSGAYACCGQPSCLREHLVVAHASVLQKTCGFEEMALDSYSYYQEAIAVRERQSMPKVGCSVDRRTFQHVSQDMSEEAVKALICMCGTCSWRYFSSLEAVFELSLQSCHQ